MTRTDEAPPSALPFPSTLRSRETCTRTLCTAPSGALAPQRVDQAIDRHRLVRVQQEHREHRSRLGSPEGERSSVRDDLEWPEDPEIHDSVLAPRERSTGSTARTSGFRALQAAVSGLQSAGYRHHRRSARQPSNGGAMNTLSTGTVRPRHTARHPGSQLPSESSSWRCRRARGVLLRIRRRDERRAGREAGIERSGLVAPDHAALNDSLAPLSGSQKPRRAVPRRRSSTTRRRPVTASTGPTPRWVPG